MMRTFVVMAGVGLAACQTAPDVPTLPPEMPMVTLIGEPDRPLPVLGRIDAIYDGQPVLWQTLDFSLGAIDPSASVRSFDGVVSVFVGGHLPGQDFNEFDTWLRIEADLPQGAVPGAATNVSIAVIDTMDTDSPRYFSGPEALLQITQITPPDLQETPFGPIAGTFVATLCRAATREAPVDPTDCKAIAGEFSTDGSFEGLR